MSEQEQEFNVLSILDKLQDGDLEKIIKARAEASNNALQSKVIEQVPELDDIIDSISMNGFFKQEVELMPKLKVGFITSSTGTGDEAHSFALAMLNDKKVADTQSAFDRIVRRRQLAHSIYSINGKNLHGMPVTLNDSPAVLEARASAEKARVDATFSFLTQYPEILFVRIEYAYFAWVSAIERKMWGEAGKQSTEHVQEALGNS